GVDAAGDHRAEPLAHIALLQTCPLGELLARRRSGARCFEQSRVVADVHHLGEHRPGVELEQLLGESHSATIPASRMRRVHLSISRATSASASTPEMRSGCAPRFSSIAAVSGLAITRSKSARRRVTMGAGVLRRTKYPAHDSISNSSTPVSRTVGTSGC